jgi:hypothetical protein
MDAQILSADLRVKVHNGPDFEDGKASLEAVIDRSGLDEGIVVLDDDTSVEFVSLVVYDNEKGHCYECGAAALFIVPDAYWNRTNDQYPPSPQTMSESHLRCGLCAANDAADGERVLRLWHDDEIEGRLNAYDRSLINAYPLNKEHN